MKKAFKIILINVQISIFNILCVALAWVRKEQFSTGGNLFNFRKVSLFHI